MEKNTICRDDENRKDFFPRAGDLHRKITNAVKRLKFTKKVLIFNSIPKVNPQSYPEISLGSIVDALML